MRGLIIWGFILLNSLSVMVGQVEVELTIENQTFNGNDFQFDIYMHTTLNTSGDLFLGTSDLVLDFNESNFSNPMLTKVGTTPGGNTFVPTDGSGINTLITQVNYFDNTTTTITNNQLVINVGAPSPGDQETFDTRIAKIDGTISTYRLGTFKISGFNSGTAGLAWHVTGAGLLTQIFSLDNTNPFDSNAALIAATDPIDASPLPVELIDFSAKEIKHQQVELYWRTNVEVNNKHFVIERSIDGLRFESIGMVLGYGTTNVVHDYKYIDSRPIEKGYYRLKQVDLDGKYEYSKIVFIALKGVTERSILAYPTIAEKEVSIRFTTFDTPKSIFKIVSFLGEVMYEEVIRGSNEWIYKKIDLHDFNSGMYNVNLTDGKDIELASFIVLKEG